MKTFRQAAAVAFPALLLAAAAQAHTGLGHAQGLTDGLIHPFAGLDHLIAMLAAGVYAGWRGGGASWRTLAVVMAAVGGGVLLGAFGVLQGPVSIGVAGMLLLLGLALLLDLRAGPALMPAAGAFGLIHGYAHGAEAAAGPGLWAYAAGLLASTAFLLAIGAMFGAAGRAHPRLGQAGVRAFGGMVGVMALFLAGA